LQRGIQDRQLAAYLLAQRFDLISPELFTELRLERAEVLGRKPRRVALVDPDGAGRVAFHAAVPDERGAEVHRVGGAYRFEVRLRLSRLWLGPLSEPSREGRGQSQAHGQQNTAGQHSPLYTWWVSAGSEMKRTA